MIGLRRSQACDLVTAIKGVSRSNAARDLDAIPEEIFEDQKLILKVLCQGCDSTCH